MVAVMYAYKDTPNMSLAIIEPLVNLAAFFSSFSLRFENRRHRPSVPVRQDPGAWWRYAILSVRDDVRKTLRRVSWRDVLELRRKRNRYVELCKLRDAAYATRAGRQRPLDKNDKEGMAEMHALEADLSVLEVREFRLQAATELDALREEWANEEPAAAEGVKGEPGGALDAALDGRALPPVAGPPPSPPPDVVGGWIWIAGWKPVIPVSGS